MGKNKRKNAIVLVLFAALFAACGILESRKPYIDTVVENHWKGWVADGKHSLNCTIDFAEAINFDWDTMLYFSGHVFLKKRLHEYREIVGYSNLLAKHSSDEQLLFLCGDSVVYRMEFFPEFDFDMEVVPKGARFCTKKLYMKLGRENAKFHLVKNGERYILYHKDGLLEEENSIKKENLSPYVGLWEWVPDDSLPRKVDVVISERNDSLYFAFSWNFMDKGASDYYTIDSEGLPIACVRMQRPAGIDCAEGKIYNSFFGVRSPIVKGYENMQLTLHGGDTLVWRYEKKYLWPDSIVLVRRDNSNYKFSDYVPYVYGDDASLQRIARNFEILDFTY